MRLKQLVYTLCVLIILCSEKSGYAQTDTVFIDSILVEGNKKTRLASILRELPFQSGDMIPLSELDARLAAGEQWLMRTGLFNQVQLYFKQWEGSSNRVQIQIEVDEAWYIFPVPLFELSDRNFNVWWVDHQRALDRINYGIDFRHRNTTGRRDRTKLILKSGYTQLFQLQYTLPFFNHAETWGISTFIQSARNREINYATIDNRQAFFRLEEGYALRRLSAQLAFTHRPKLDRSYQINLGYFNNQLDTIVSQQLNPNYFTRGSTSQRYFSLSFSYNFDNRDVRPYPLNGTYLQLELEKDGLGILRDRNGLTFNGDYRRYLDIGRGWNVALSAKGKYSLIRTPQPYNDNRAIGFMEKNLHGYEYYVIDGLDLFMVNSSLRIKLWQDQINFGKLVPFEPLRNMPVKMLASLNSDWGYVHNPWDTFDNSFNNRLLWGGGLGLDLVFYFDFVLRIEASVNHLKEPGLFLHFNTGL